MDRTVLLGLLDLADRAESAEDALRSLASWLGVGGYNADKVDAAIFERKIRDGVDMVVRVERKRARGPQISDSEETALLRRTNLEFQQRTEAVEAERDRLVARVRELETELGKWSNVPEMHAADCLNYLQAIDRLKDQVAAARRDALVECERIASDTWEAISADLMSNGHASSGAAAVRRAIAAKLRELDAAAPRKGDGK